MLKKENRLKKKKDFDIVFKQGVFKKSSFILFGFKENNLDYSRFGIIISKKISNKAVVRNKIKRRIREIVRNKIDQIKKGFDIIIVPYKGIEEKSFQEIEKEIIKNLRVLINHKLQAPKHKQITNYKPQIINN